MLVPDSALPGRRPTLAMLWLHLCLLSFALPMLAFFCSTYACFFCSTYACFFALPMLAFFALHMLAFLLYLCSLFCSTYACLFCSTYAFLLFAFCSTSTPAQKSSFPVANFRNLHRAETRAGARAGALRNRKSARASTTNDPEAAARVPFCAAYALF